MRAIRKLPINYDYDSSSTEERKPTETGLCRKKKTLFKRKSEISYTLWESAKWQVGVLLCTFSDYDDWR